jgi:multidrug resistance efflux pump
MSEHAGSEQEQKSPSKHRHWWQTPRAKRVLTVTAIVAVLGIVVWRVKYYPYVSTEDARVAMTTIRLAPSGAGGQIIKVNGTEGTWVEKGDVIVELDHRGPQAKLDQARARAEFSEKELHRVKQLAARHTATAQALDNATANYKTAQAGLKQAELAVENTYLKSPIKGIVIQQLAEVGNILGPGQTATTIVDADHAWISANIEETSVKLVKVGQPVTIHIDEGGDYTGKVSEIRTATASTFALIPSDNASGNFTKLVQRIPVKITLDPDQDANPRIGESAEIKIRVH